MDTEWIKAAAAQVRITIKQTINKVDRIGNSESGHARRSAVDDAPTTRNLPKGKDPGADNN